MKLTIGRGRKTTRIEFPTGPSVGVTPAHVDQMCEIMRSRGVRFSY